MSKKQRFLLLVAACVAFILMIILCAMIFPRRSEPVPPATPVQVEESPDCDDEDRRNREIEDCGLSVLIDPKKSTKPTVTTAPVKTAGPRCTPTRTRRCP